MLALFLVPVPAGPGPGPRWLDKLVHFGLFLGFALLDRLTERAGWTRILLVSIGFAGGVELLQGLLGYRSAEWLDFVAGAAGAAAGSGVLMILDRRRGAAHGEP